ncbi:MAG: proton-conducting transporter membrane subunit, partial [Candidatus Didemnitutus sp.]|nr:proton-conducting transporter membrane subunit [Candidatus Didemnitutus sp.]
MSIELLKAAADSNQWVALTPEIMLACGALFLLVMEIILPKDQHRFIPLAAIMTMGAVLVALSLNFYTSWLGEATFGGLLLHSMPGQFARVFFVISSLLVCFIAGLVLPRSKMPRVEFYHIVMVVTAAMMLLVQSNHFVMFFVALETVTVGFYILVSYFRNNALTLEAGLKYLIMGALSSAIMLFGIVLLYGAVGRVEGADGIVHNGFEFDTV